MTKYSSLIAAAIATGLALAMPAMAMAAGQSPVKSKTLSEAQTGATLQVPSAKAGRTVVISSVNTPETAWIVVRSVDLNGPILGKIRIARGDRHNVAVPLSEATRPGERIVLTLNAARTNGKFDQASDTQLSTNGKPVMAQVTVQ